MKTKKLLLVASVTLATLLVIQIIKRRKAENRLQRRLLAVADEGYETAEDILFPRKKFYERKSRL